MSKKPKLLFDADRGEFYRNEKGKRHYVDTVKEERMTDKKPILRIVK